MPRAIVNSTPIILLAGIGRLSLLPKLYDRILIPNAVYEEVTAKADLASRAISGHPSWLTVERAPELPREQRRLISAKLHAGEIEVMSLALSSDADVVVLDDRAARKTAKFFGLPVKLARWDSCCGQRIAVWWKRSFLSSTGFAQTGSASRTG